MKTYNIEFENVDPILEWDIRKNLTHFLTHPIKDSKSKYKISVNSNNEIEILKDIKYIDYMIYDQYDLWDDIKYLIPIEKNTIFISSNKYNDLIDYLIYTFHVPFYEKFIISKITNKNVIIIGECDDFHDISLYKKYMKSLRIISINDINNSNLEYLKYADTVDILSPSINQNLLKLNNVNVIDLSMIICKKIINDFLNIRRT